MTVTGSCELRGQGFIVKKVTLSVILVCLVHLFMLRVAASSCGGGTSDGTFLGGVRCPSHKTVCSHANGLLIFGRPTCSVAVIPGRMRGLSALSLYRSLGVAHTRFLGVVDSVGSHHQGPKCSECAGRLFVSRLSTRRYNIFRRGLFGFHNFCVRQHAVHRCSCSTTTRTLNSVKRISTGRVRTSRRNCCVHNSCINGLNMRGSCRGCLHKRGNVRVLLHSTRKHVRKRCVSKRCSHPSMPKGGLALDLSVSLRVLNRQLLGGGVKDVITVRPRAKRVLYLMSSPGCSPRLVVNHRHKGGRLVLRHSGVGPLLGHTLVKMCPPNSAFGATRKLAFLRRNVIARRNPSFPYSHNFRCNELAIKYRTRKTPVPLVPTVTASYGSCFY